MALIHIPQVYDEFLEYFTEKATPEEIMAFQVSEAANERAAELLDKNNAGTLTLEETIELEQMLYFDRKFSVLKARAAAEIKKRNGSSQ